MQIIQQAKYKDLDVEIAIGFDSQLQGYFMTVGPANEDAVHPDIDEETGLIYSNLDDDRLPFPRLPKQIDHFRAVLRELKIEVPGDFFETVLAKCS